MIHKNPAFLGAQKWAEMLHHPCIPNKGGQKQKWLPQPYPHGSHLLAPAAGFTSSLSQNDADWRVLSTTDVRNVTERQEVPDHEELHTHQWCAACSRSFTLACSADVTENCIRDLPEHACAPGGWMGCVFLQWLCPPPPNCSLEEGTLGGGAPLLLGWGPCGPIASGGGVDCSSRCMARDRMPGLGCSLRRQ